MKHPTGPELKKRRIEAKVSAAVFAEAAGVSQATLWLFENGKKIGREKTLEAIIGAYDRLDSLEKKHGRGPAKEKKKRGRPGRPPKIKAKRKYVRKPKPAPEKDPGDDGDPDDGLDDVMKRSAGVRRKGWKPPVPEEKKLLDDEWLKAQMDNWTKTRRVVVVNMETPGEPEAPAKRFLMVSEAQVYALGRDIMTACKRPVNQA